MDIVAELPWPVGIVREVFAFLGVNPSRRVGCKGVETCVVQRKGFFCRAVTIVALATSASSQVSWAATCFVTQDAPAEGNGVAWDSPVALQTALASPDCTEIWVAGGVYKPTATGDRQVSFVIPHGVAVYGGFGGVESSPVERVPGAHPSILSGDIDNNDTTTAGVDVSTADIVGGNSYHVVLIDGHLSPVTRSSIVDGFTITGGKAVADAIEGGGMVCWCGLSFGGNTECSPTLSNLTFSGNLAEKAGGALVLDGDYGGKVLPLLVNVTFRNNAVVGTYYGAGGALFSTGGISGVACPTLINVTFSGNVARNDLKQATGGAIYNEGSGATCNPELRNVTFSGNSADIGGAMYNYSTGSLSPSIVNTIFWGDAASLGPEILGSGTPVIADSVVAGGCPAGSQCGTVYADDPQLGPLQDNGGFTLTISIGLRGSATDRGVDCPATDQRGVARPQGSACDIGAYENTDNIFASDFDGA